MKISVIIPSFNAVDKIGRCIASLCAIDLNPTDYEILFIDDCSTDETYKLIQRACVGHPNWRSLQLDKNSGSPSRPRNYGIDFALGDYLFFLDCDDEILPSALSNLLEHAEQKNACLVRSELLVDDCREKKRMNQISEWSDSLLLMERREIIITKTSTVINSFVKRSLLVKNNIRWPEHIRMGEDSIFLAEVLINADRIEYLAEPTFVYYKTPSIEPSSTQSYGKRELENHLVVWNTVQELMMPLGIDYLRGRLQVGLQVALELLIFRNRGDVDDVVFRKLRKFILENWNLINKFHYKKRIKEILQSINTGDYLLFSDLCRPRLLIAGHDLKFIKDAKIALEKYFDIRIDEWKGHELHDEKQSEELLDWAEYIWCEWLLKNAEWYSARKRPDQRLVIRMHRMELGRNHGEHINIDNVDALITVSTLFFERLLERYSNIPRQKVRVIPNYVRLEEYSTDWHPDRLHTLGVIGILPSRKGYHRALEILRELRLKDDRYRLEVFGHRPEELPWVARDAKEMEYFEECEKFIQQHGLHDAISFNGHVDITKALAERRVGFVLSVSESEVGFPGPESFHLAVADGFASRGLSLIRRWQGSEYLWPQKFLIDGEGDAVKQILRYSADPMLFKVTAEEGRSSICSRYSLSDFTRAVTELYREIR